MNEFKRLFDKYADTVIYILMLVVLATLVCTTVEMKKEVRALEDRVSELTEACVELQDEVRNAHREPENGLQTPSREVVAKEPEKKFYTDADAVALAQVAWGEARGVPALETVEGSVSTKCQQAAVMWTVLNRFDAGYSDTILSTVSAANQFHGYNKNHPVEDDLLALAYDVLDRWNREKNGETDIFRELPSDYFWFYGDGKHNHFRNKYSGGERYNWEAVLG